MRFLIFFLYQSSRRDNLILFKGNSLRFENLHFLRHYTDTEKNNTYINNDFTFVSINKIFLLKSNFFLFQSLSQCIINITKTSMAEINDKRNYK